MAITQKFIFKYSTENFGWKNNEIVECESASHLYATFKYENATTAERRLQFNIGHVSITDGQDDITISNYGDTIPTAESLFSYSFGIGDTIEFEQEQEQEYYYYSYY